MTALIPLYFLAVAATIAAMYPLYRLAFRGARRDFGRERLWLLALIAVAATAPGAMALVRTVRESSGPGHISVTVTEMTAEITVVSPVRGFDLPALMSLLFWAGVAAMVLITAVSFVRMAVVIARGRRLRRDGYTLVVTPDTQQAVSVPFSWGRYVVVRESDCDAEMVLDHERSHVRHRHWIDLLLTRLLLIFNWFNPVAWLLVRDLRMVHEFQADSDVAAYGHDVRTYMTMLVCRAAGRSRTALVNNLNRNNLTKRITMMLSSKPSRRRLPAVALVLPSLLLAGASTALTGADSALASVLSSAKMPDTPAITVSTVATVAATEIPATDARKSVTNTSTFTVRKNPGEQTTTETAAEAAVSIDGKIVSKAELNNLDPSQIVSMTIVKDDPANPDGLIKVVTKNQSTKPTVAAETMPHFPGGDKALMMWLTQNLRWPEGAPQDGVKRRAVVTFTVSKSGKITSPELVKSTGVDILDAETMRVVSEMPDFEPGTVDGKAIDVKYTMPVTFSSTTEDDNSAK